MRYILIFFVLMLKINHSFSNIDYYIEQEFERNRTEYNCIKHLDFRSKQSNNFIHLNELGLQLILEKNDALEDLESLNLLGNDLSEIMIHDFIDRLVYLTPNLKILNLSYNRIGFMGASSIGNASHSWKNLETLSLYNAHIDEAGMLTLFIKLSKHPNLKDLDIGSNAPFSKESAYKIGHRFAAFQKLEFISFNNLGLTDTLMDAFLKGIDHYKMPYQNKCIMPLKSIHFGNNLKSLHKIMQFMEALDHTYQFDFYCKNKQFTINKENHKITIKEKYLLKILNPQDNKIIKQKQIYKTRSML